MPPVQPFGKNVEPIAESADEQRRWKAALQRKAVRPLGIWDRRMGHWPRLYWTPSPKKFPPSKGSFDAAPGWKMRLWRRAEANPKGPQAFAQNAPDGRNAQTLVDDLWAGLLQRDWVLNDCFETDGRLFVVARKADAASTRCPGLSRREFRVLVLRAKGASLKDVAAQLGVSIPAVSQAVRSAMGKLGIISPLKLLVWVDAVEAQLSDATGVGIHAVAPGQAAQAVHA